MFVKVIPTHPLIVFAVLLLLEPGYQEEALQEASQLSTADQFQAFRYPQRNTGKLEIANTIHIMASGSL